MSIHFSGFLHHFVIAKLATSGIRIKSRLFSGKIRSSAQCIRQVSIPTGSRSNKEYHSKAMMYQRCNPIVPGNYLTSSTNQNHPPSLTSFPYSTLTYLRENPPHDPRRNRKIFCAHYANATGRDRR